MNDEEVQKIIATAIAQMKEAIASFDAGKMGWTQFKATSFRLMRGVYGDTAKAAVKGALTADERSQVESALAQQFYPSGNDWSLSDRLQEHADGGISIAQLGASLAMYLKSSRSSAVDVWAGRNEEQLGYRTLGATDKHCAACVLFSMVPPQAIADVVKPGRSCKCFSNCLCTIQVVGDEDTAIRRPPQGDRDWSDGVEYPDGSRYTTRLNG